MHRAGVVFMYFSSSVCFVRFVFTAVRCFACFIFFLLQVLSCPAAPESLIFSRAGVARSSGRYLVALMRTDDDAMNGRYRPRF